MARITFTLASILLFNFLSFSQSTPELMGVTSRGGTSNAGTIFSLTPDGNDFKLRHHFDEVAPHTIYGSLLLASDGNLYGTTYDGGMARSGTIFRMGIDGNNFEVIHHFNEADGDRPRAAPIEGSDGKLYGTTTFGGNNKAGVIYKLEKNGNGFSILHHFNGAGGELPFGKLLGSPDGKLYGMTNKGGIYGDGTAYSIAKDGSGFSVFHSFEGGTEGRNPFGGFIEDATGTLYATLSTGGPELGGTVFKIGKSGANFTLLKKFDFSADNGNVPFCTLLEATDGKLYGTTFSGGADYVGIIFSLDKNGNNYSILHEFSPTKGRNPFHGNQLLETPDGTLYGTTIRGGNKNLGVVYKINKNGSGFGLLHEFEENGKSPYAGLLLAGGKLIGTTSAGGDSEGGVVYSINQDGSGFAKVHDFSRVNDNGFFPSANLVRASNGLVYGSTQEGGGHGFGTLFKVKADGSTFETIYHFDGQKGAYPINGLLAASDGMLYGTASEGGSFGNGTIFRIDPTNDAFSQLYTFSDVGENGAIPRASLIEGIDGKLYGTAQSGGIYGAGTVYRLNKNGSGLEAVHHFVSNGNTGRTPFYKLYQNAGGQLFGVTIFGGSTSINEDGTLFRLNADGTGFEVLQIFNNNENGTPSGPLVSNNDGFLYGLTSNGGNNLVGIIYRISMDGQTFEILHHFDVVNGIGALGSLLPNPQGDWLYGIARAGGPTDDGIVFRIKPDGSVFENIYGFEGFPDGGSCPSGGLLWLSPMNATDDLPLLEGLSVSPNPSSGPFSIIWKNGFPSEKMAAFTLVDGSGNLVLKTMGNLPQINVLLKEKSMGFRNGVYFLRLEMEERIFMEKIVLRK